MSEAVDLKYLRWLRRLQYVPRWSVIPTIKDQNVATHSYYVACFAMFLLENHPRGNDGAFCLEVLRRSLTHDVKEAAEGDAPSPSKKQYMINDQPYVVMKVADIMEAYVFILEERGMGNIAGTVGILDDLQMRLEPWVEALEGNITTHSLIEFMFNMVYSGTHPALEEKKCFPIK